MTVRKRLLKLGALQVVLAWAAASYIRLVHRTTRWTVEWPAESQAIVGAQRPFICCFWHGRLVMMLAAKPASQPTYVLVSGHRDGLLIARGVAHFGIDSVEGSSRRGGAEALRRIAQLVKAGAAVAITPDGPRGPNMRAKAGAIKAAQLSGAPILAVTGAVSRRWLLGSWDRFCLALPFSDGVISWSEPITVPREADDAELERLRLVLEDRLNALTAEADRRCGQSAVEPAPAPGTIGHAGA
jgi:lysophospholipid acyltransferase (LPLAT)-like uncharacterized protein